jgi:thiamine transport system substrate-binding protein
MADDERPTAESTTSRRAVLATVGGAALTGLAGCSGESGDGTDTATSTEAATETTTVGTTDTGADLLRVATYPAFVEASSGSSPGAWVKENFESEFDATLEWFTPSNGLNYFVQRRSAGVTIDADAYVGLNVDDLVTIDRTLGDRRLLRPLDRAAMEHADDVKPALEIDPEGRALPYDTGYISLVYDGRAVENPGTFEALTESAYEGALLAENAQSSDPGKAFMLWTVNEYGPDGYLDYWRRLVENDVRILGSWNDAYGAWSEGERPVVVSYSTDRVFANRFDQNLQKHQVGFLNDQGYANPEGMAAIEGTDTPDLARRFLDWMLSKPVQEAVAVRNVQFPATTTAAPGGEFGQYALEPPETVTYSYDDLVGNVSDWVDQWAREIAGG